MLASAVVSTEIRLFTIELLSRIHSVARERCALIAGRECRDDHSAHGDDVRRSTATIHRSAHGISAVLPCLRRRRLRVGL